MEVTRTNELQKILDFAKARTQAWYDAADRAAVRNEPVLATYYRNIGWKIENGREWLDDVVVTQPLPPRVTQ